jgi:hypothetical protein
MGFVLGLVGALWATIGVVGVAAAWAGHLGTDVALTSLSVGLFPGLVLAALGLICWKLGRLVELTERERAR